MRGLLYHILSPIARRRNPSPCTSRREEALISDGTCRPCGARLIRSAWVISLAVALAIQANAQPRPVPRTHYQRIAYSLRQLAQHTEWPKETFAKEQEPFVLGILGEDPF